MPTRLTFRDATATDVPTIAALHNAAAGALTARHGAGRWSGFMTERGAELSLRHARVRLGRSGKQVFTMLRLAQKKPWAIDVAYFTPVPRAVYLTNMVVSVAAQGLGLGRMAIADAMKVADAWPAQAIRLDAYDGPGGGGPFYERCGFVERGQVTYRGNPLVYYEMLLTGGR